ncbi:MULTISPECIES: MFS transporter [unclassified Endozoicomonas]|uniref:MFS transporter n=1 Tax=unclassified Endozoicomonas TaxID=2644528 RepID=UPI003BB6E493
MAYPSPACFTNPLSTGLMTQTTPKRCITASSSQYKLASSISLGGMLEIYDFLIYGLMASYIAENFFPAEDHITSLINTFATFAIGYLTRPLGGIVFGHFGDRYGRKKTFTFSIFLMAVTTALMGCLPGWNSIGSAAPITLILLRLLQGFSLGGEIPGSITYLSETTPERRGLVIGILFLAIMIGVSFGTFVHGILEMYLSAEDMKEWGWRVPFWIGGSLGIISYHIRKHFSESGFFEALDQTKAQASIPIVLLFTQHTRGVICGLMTIGLCGATVTVYSIYMPGFLSSLLGFPREAVAWQTTLAFLMLSPLCLIFGLLSDLINHKLILGIMAIIVATTCWPAFQYFSSPDAELNKILLICGLLAATASGALPPLLISFFPTEIRYTGIATCYNIGFAIFGGIAPVTSTLLAKYSSNTTGPAIYLSLVAVISLIALFIPWPNVQLTTEQFDEERNL